MEENKNNEEKLEKPEIKSAINKIKEGVAEAFKSGVNKTKDISNNINEKVTEAKEMSKRERLIDSLKTEISLKILEITRNYPLEKIKVNVEATLREDTDIAVDVTFVGEDKDEDSKE